VGSVFFDPDPDQRKMQVPIPSRSCSESCPESILVLVLSHFHPGFGPNPVPILSRFCPDPVAIPLRSKRELGLVSGPKLHFDYL
jgi:hypothetical protein